MDEAEQVLRDALELDVYVDESHPLYARPYAALSNACLRRGDTQGAEQIVCRALAGNSTDFILNTHPQLLEVVERLAEEGSWRARIFLGTWIVPVAERVAFLSKALDQAVSEASDPDELYRVYCLIENDPHEPTSESALRLLTEAAEQGHREAIGDLAYYYIEIEFDEVAGAKWYQRARELGAHIDAVALGILYPMVKFGDPLESLTKAAYASKKSAQYALGTLYANGVYGAEYSIARAYAWFSIALNVEPGTPVSLVCGPSPHAGRGTPERAYRLLTALLNESEIAQAREEYQEIRSALENSDSTR